MMMMYSDFCNDLTKIVVFQRMFRMFAKNCTVNKGAQPQKNFGTNVEGGERVMFSGKTFFRYLAFFFSFKVLRALHYILIQETHFEQFAIQEESALSKAD